MQFSSLNQIYLDQTKFICVSLHNKSILPLPCPSPHTGQLLLSVIQACSKWHISTWLTQLSYCYDNIFNYIPVTVHTTFLSTLSVSC